MGGVVRLIVDGTLEVEGQISANGNGGDAHGGGGSGGSIYLTVGTLAGDGVISANGGAASNPNSGGGGGGRVAIEYGVNDYLGAVTAYGGGVTRYGGAGTCYWKDAADAVGTVEIDNGSHPYSWTPLTSPEEFNVVISNGAIAYPTAGLEIGNLEVLEAGRLTHDTMDAGFNLKVSGGATVASGGWIDASGRGHGSTGGAGGGRSAYYSSGGGYGGLGGASSDVPGGGTYGMAIEPTELGSGGGGGGSAGRGGGIIRMTVADTLLVDGAIHADGWAGTSHGGRWFGW